MVVHNYVAIALLYTASVYIMHEMCVFNVFSVYCVFCLNLHKV